MKKILSFILLVSIMFCIGAVAFADGNEVMPGETRNEVTQDEVITKVHTGGTVLVNNGTVMTNEGGIETNNGYLGDNKGDIITNNGLVGKNTGGVSVNNFQVVNEASNNCEVRENYGVVINGAPSGNKGYITYADGNSAVLGITYEEPKKDAKDGQYNRQNVVTTYSNATTEKGNIYVFTPANATLKAPEIDVADKQAVWENTETLDQYLPGETVLITNQTKYKLLWIDRPSGSSQNADYFYADYNGVYEGKTFLMNQPLENFENVSCNGAYLEKGTDYTVEADGTMTRVTFTAKFFEKFGNGPVPVAPLFHGAVYCLAAVNK